MQKDELILMLDEGLSIEEVKIMPLLDELKDLVESSDFDSKTKKGILREITVLRKETSDHSRHLTEAIKYVIKSKKNGY